MTARKLLIAFSVFLLCTGRMALKAQQSNVAIVLNEYSATNIGGPADNYGQLSDWVELYNAHTSAVNLNGYYLSNDRYNLFKWKFPSNFTMGVGEFKVVWLSGRNVSSNNNFHANFTLDQCKGQWLILTTSAGVIRDSVFVQPCKVGHTRGRVDIQNIGIGAWKLYTTHSYLQPNPLINNYIDYAPKPALFATTPSTPITDTTNKVNTGGFESGGAQIYKVKIKGFDYDTINFPCYEIYYKLGGDYPTPGNWTRYYDVISTPITIDGTNIVRIITVPSNSTGCTPGYLESFCETNTYFIQPEHQNFDSRFGVISLAIDRSDTTWFNSQGIPASTTVHVEYYDGKKQYSEGYAILNRPPNETWVTSQKGYYISIDDKYGFGCNFEGQIFNVADLGTSDRKTFQTLHVKSGDFESASPNLYNGSLDGTGLRDVFYQTLATKYNLNVNPLHVKPVITFVNGKYWGVSNLTEVYDKYYENYYNGQSLDSLDLCFYNNGDASVSYPDGSVSTFSNNFKSQVYDIVSKYPLKSSDPGSYYAKVMAQLDKNSFIDYMILNSFGMNSEIWNYNVAFARGYRNNKPGNKWHYYMWNTPTVFNYTYSPHSSTFYTSAYTTPCFIQSISGFSVSPKAHNSHGYIFSRLMDVTNGNPTFRQEYLNRYQDLINGPLKCENLIKHWKLIDTLYSVEMLCHEDPACAAGPGKFVASKPSWVKNMTMFDSILSARCYYMEARAFQTSGCYGMNGPFAVTIDVSPTGAGKVKLNSTVLDSYPWVGHYYQTQMSFKAIPTNTNYAFHHWEFQKHTPKNPLSMDSVVVQSWTYNDNVVAVFTDVTNPISSGQNIPTGFTPNGDNNNDFFKPLGSAEYAQDFQMTIWNRWGQEVYRSTNPNDVGWDGKYHGQDVPTGVYAYIITYKNVYGESKVVKNNVTLTR